MNEIISKSFGNKERLKTLFLLKENNELTVNELVERVGISQPSMSQHLALLRKLKVLDYRKEKCFQYYYIADKRIEQLIQNMKTLFNVPPMED